eukprot:COSAG06_NODE_43458_length_372_cov_0.443223_1_plen_34_part_01
MSKNGCNRLLAKFTALELPYQYVEVSTNAYPRGN